MIDFTDDLVQLTNVGLISNGPNQLINELDAKGFAAAFATLRDQVKISVTNIAALQKLSPKNNTDVQTATKIAFQVQQVQQLQRDVTDFNWLVIDSWRHQNGQPSITTDMPATIGDKVSQQARQVA